MLCDRRRRLGTVRPTDTPVPRVVVSLDGVGRVGGPRGVNANQNVDPTQRTPDPSGMVRMSP